MRTSTQFSRQDLNNATAYPGSDALRGHLVPGMTNMRASTLNSRHNLNIGCWNVRTLLDVGRQALVARALWDYKIDIACLSEVRLPESGSREIKVPQQEAEYVLLHSGPQTNTGQHGVAIAMTKQVHNTLLAFDPISERIATARFKGSLTNMSVIAVYAPTLQADETVKSEFYEQLQATMDRIPPRDLLFVAGDWNARTGPCDETTRHILGRYGLGQRCDNGERLITFADYNHLVVTNTRFQHPHRQLLTWYSNDGRTANQIDYILVRSRWATSVSDSRVSRCGGWIRPRTCPCSLQAPLVDSK